MLEMLLYMDALWRKMVLNLMKFKGIDIHLIRGYCYMYYNWSSCVLKVSKFILIQYFCGYILLYGMIPLRSAILKYIPSPHPSGPSGPFFKCKDHTRSVSRLVSVFVCILCSATEYIYCLCVAEYN